MNNFMFMKPLVSLYISLVVSKNIALFVCRWKDWAIHIQQ